MGSFTKEEKGWQGRKEGRSKDGGKESRKSIANNVDK